MESALRKAGLRLIPLAAVGYAIAYVDRTNLSFAALQMNRAIGLSPATYGLGAGLFFVSYAVCELPSNLLLVRFGARRWLSRVLITWGLVAMGMAFVRNPRQFCALRLALGIAEAGFLPGILYYLTQWFPPDLHARAISRFYLSLPIGSAIMGFAAGALLGLQGLGGLAGWQWLFLIEGLPAVLLGFIFLFWLPDHPAQARWLSPEEREWMTHRMETEAAAAAPRAGARGGVLAALSDLRVWQIGIHRMLLVLAYYAFEFTAPLILQGYGRLSSGQIGFVLGALHLSGAAAMLCNGRHSDRTGERYWHIVVPCAVMAAGFCAAGLANTAVVGLAGFAAVLLGFNAMQGTVWALPPEFLAGKSAAAGIAAINTFAIVGGFLGPYEMGLWKSATGGYHLGLVLLAVPTVAAAAIMLDLRRRTMARRRETGPLPGQKARRPSQA